MSKRIHYIFAVLSIVLLSLTLQTFTPVLGLNAIETDPENDVYRIHATESSQDISKGDYHDEIDIVKLEVNGQNINLTFAGNMVDWQSNDSFYTQAIIILHPDFKSLEDMTYPFYALIYDNFSSYGLGFKVFFTNQTEFDDEEYWDGSGWIGSPSSAIEVGNASEKSITAYVPPAAYTIPDDITFLAEALILEEIGYYEAFAYADIAPNKYDPFASEDKIPSYNLFIVVGLLFGISLIIIKKQIGKK